MLAVSLYLVTWTVFIGISTWSERSQELKLTLLAAFMLSTVLVMNFSLVILALCLLGIVLGVVIEVFMVLKTRQQYWLNASFFGIPYWLPLVWGYGFMVMYLTGLALEKWLI